MATQPVPRVFPIAPGSSSTFWFTGIIVGFLVLFPFALLLVPLWPGKIYLEVSNAGLRITGSIYSRLIPHPEGKSAKRWIPSDEPGYQPVGRTNGVGLPNYRGGWFRLANGSKALVFLTDDSRSVLVPTDEGYTLLASPEDPDGLIAALAARNSPTRDLQPVRFPLAQPTSSSSSLQNYFLIVSIAPLLIGLLLGALTWVSRRVCFEVSREGIRVRGPYGRLLPREGLNVKEARIVDLRTEPEFRGMIRTNGIGMPGFGAGWFRYKGGQSALVFLTDQSRAVAIPTNFGYTLIVSPADPEGFLAALQAS
jgi:hypothetical protein